MLWSAVLFNPSNAIRYTQLTAIAEVASGSWSQLIHEVAAAISHQDLLLERTAAGDVISKTHQAFHAAIGLVRVRAVQPSGILCVAAPGAWARARHLNAGGARKSVPALREVLVALAQYLFEVDVSVSLGEQRVVVTFIRYQPQIVT